MWALLLGTLTIMVFSLPLVPAVSEWRRRRDIAPLPIDSDHTLDVAAVAAELRALLATDAATGGADGNATTLGQVIRVGNVWAPNEREIATRSCASVIAADGTLILPDAFIFEKSLYAKHGLYGGKGNTLQAVLSEGPLIIRHDSILQRWAYAPKVHVESNCQLLGPVSASALIVVDGDCSFTSLSATSIHFGRRPSPPRVPEAAVAPGGESATTERTIIPHDHLLPHASHHRGDLVVHGDLVVGTQSWIEGSVKATGTIRVGKSVFVGGALMCGDALSIGGYCAIVGPVTSEHAIDVGPNCAIGTIRRPTSVVAPAVRIAVGTVVYGAVSAFDEGRVVPVASRH